MRKNFQKIDEKRILAKITPDFTINNGDIGGKFTNFLDLMKEITKQGGGMGSIKNDMNSINSTDFYNGKENLEGILGNISDVGLIKQN